TVRLRDNFQELNHQRVSGLRALDMDWPGKGMRAKRIGKQGFNSREILHGDVRRHLSSPVAQGREEDLITRANLKCRLRQGIDSSHGYIFLGGFENMQCGGECFHLGYFFTALDWGVPAVC